ncbi:MAG: ABC transporter permease [Chloroflexi bacterium]|nr:ABC transporter permease [Chloroflexota bacterium]
MRRKIQRYFWLLVSGAIILAIVLVAIFAPVLARYDPLKIDPLRVLQSPSPQNPLGTDEFGRDVLSRLIYGAQPSLIVAVGATTLAMVIGVFLGVIAGFFRGWIEQILMRLVDALLCFPPILLAMVVVGLLGPGVTNLVIVIGILYSTTFARLAYASTMQVKAMEYVTVAMAVGVDNRGLIWRHILPNILSPLIVQASLTAAATILLESGLSFLGLGVVPPTPSWGLIIGAARNYMYQSPLYVLWPSLLIAGIVLAINTFGDTLRDFLDPRLRKWI